MSRRALAVVAAAGLAGLSCGALAATQSEFDAAYAAAAQAEAQAGALHDQWIPTEAALKAARQAAEEKRYDEASALARRAEALAKASISQAQAQQSLWREAVVK